MLTFILIGALLVLILGAFTTYKSVTAHPSAQERLRRLRHIDHRQPHRTVGPGDN
ncbi:MAG TPA: hypothetical protein VGC07_10505 [Granulicella sp.]